MYMIVLYGTTYIVTFIGIHIIISYRYTTRMHIFIHGHHTIPYHITSYHIISHHISYSHHLSYHIIYDISFISYHITSYIIYHIDFIYTILFGNKPLTQRGTSRRARPPRPSGASARCRPRARRSSSTPSQPAMCGRGSCRGG